MVILTAVSASTGTGASKPLVAPSAVTPNLTGLTPEQALKLGINQTAIDRTGAAERGNMTTGMVALKSAQNRKKYLEGQMTKLKYEKTRDADKLVLEKIKADAIKSNNLRQADLAQAKIDDIRNEQAARKVIEEKVKNHEPVTNLDRQLAGLKPDETGTKGDMTDAQAATYIGKQFYDTGAFSEFTGQETKRRMVNAAMELSKTYSGGTRTEKALKAVKEIRQRIAQYYQLIKDGKHPKEKVQNDFMAKFGFIPGAD